VVDDSMQRREGREGREKEDDKGMESGKGSGRGTWGKAEGRERGIGAREEIGNGMGGRGER